MLRWLRRARPTARESFHDASAAAAAARWLGTLAAECAGRGIPLPAVLTVEVGTASVRLQLAAARPLAPAPWLSSHHDTVWTRRIETTDAAPGGQVPRGLTAVGLVDRRTMLVDLTASGAPIALLGDEVDRLEVARRWVDERSRAPWSRGFPIVLVDLAELATDNTVEYSERQLSRLVAMGGEGFAILREAPTGQAGRAMLEALRAPGCRWCVVILGAAPAHWTFRARPDGAVTCEVFPAPSAVPDAIGAKR